MIPFAPKFIRSIKSHPLFYLLLTSLLIRIAYLFIYPNLWWDTYIYIAMGKYIFSGGELGIWESFRPLIHPLILGAFWKIGLSPLIIGKILDIIFSLLSIYLVYLIGIRVFHKTAALLAAFIFSFTPLFIMFSGLVLTEPLALFIGLLGILFLRDLILVSLKETFGKC